MSTDYAHNARLLKMTRLSLAAKEAGFTSSDLRGFSAEQRHDLAVKANVHDASDTTWTALVDGLRDYEHASAMPADVFEGLV